MNALTARRLVEHRTEHGKFENREALKQVSGVGDQTFVQAAGFLRIHGGDTPLDSTSIHPESYEIANDILKRANTSLAELFVNPETTPQPQPPQLAKAANSPAPAENATANPDAQSQPVATQASPTPPSDTASPETASPETASPEATSPETASPEATSPESPNSDTPTTADEAPANPVNEAPAPKAPASPVASSESSESSESDASAKAAAAEPKNAAPKSDSNTDTETDTPAEPPKATETSAVANAKPVGSSPPSKPPRPNPEALAKRKEILKRISDLDIDQISNERSAGKLLVKDILMSLKRPNWDPRGKSRRHIFRSGIIKSEDLKVEMELEGQVVNVVDFGVFVDIGLGESSLVHVSQLSNRFVRDPHELHAVGDVLKVWVSEIDSERRRVKLTAIRPNSKRPPRRKKRYEGKSESKPHARRSSSKETEGAGSKGAGSKSRKPGKYDSRSKRFAGSRASKSSYKPRPRKPKPVKPITEGMLEGKEPMRSFSDLVQFVKGTPDKKKGKEKTESKDKKSADEKAT